MPVTPLAKVITSSPPVLLAAVIASRRVQPSPVVATVQTPSPGSAMLVTTRGAAPAGSARANAISATKIAPKLREVKNKFLGPAENAVFLRNRSAISIRCQGDWRRLTTSNLEACGSDPSQSFPE